MPNTQFNLTAYGGRLIATLGRVKPSLHAPKQGLALLPAAEIRTAD